MKILSPYSPPGPVRRAAPSPRFERKSTPQALGRHSTRQAIDARCVFCLVTPGGVALVGGVKVRLSGGRRIVAGGAAGEGRSART